MAVILGRDGAHAIRESVSTLTAVETGGGDTALQVKGFGERVAVMKDVLLRLTVHIFPAVAFSVDMVPDASAEVARQMNVLVE